jgi:inorganic pyrophosphatase
MKQQTMVTVMVESPKGYNQKFNYDEESKRFKVSKLLPAGLVFPFDFGMIPNTKGEDGDPLDVIVLSENPTFPGCLVDCRIIGALKSEQTERNGDTMRNDRFIGVSQVSKIFADAKTLDDLPANTIDELEAFFINYNQQAGKQFKVLERLAAKQAANLVKT